MSYNLWKAGIIYECMRCGRKFEKSNIDALRHLGLQCPFCGYRIILKSRPQVAKRVRTD
ncbi:MAG: DNA-directed RNA polymerase subunit P [Thermofilum sp. ex4484_79]|nr:MAG: DNA-directed RNA polymerase subunit P [Thermofilum sp. ex4484_79]HDD64436.1 DNA-directed RNA polymerase subunit P [Thermoprotei archaeon]